PLPHPLPHPPTTMHSPRLNQLGSWNPQLLRELRGRLQPRSLAAALVLPLLGQLILCLLVIQPGGTNLQSQRWLGVFSLLTWTLPFGLFGLGSYYLVSDITQEDKRGTLDFIRLSPRPGWQIILGKILGVPILPYLALLTLVPLHFGAGLVAGVSPLFVLSYYLVLLVGALLCYSLALLYGLSSGSQMPGVNRLGTTSASFGAIAVLVLTPLFMFWNLGVTWNPFGPIGTLNPYGGDADWLYWGFIPVNSNLITSHGFTLANLIMVIILVWRIVLRRFRRPRATFLSKRQGYAILAYLELLMIGFSLRPDLFNRSETLGLAIVAYLLSAIAFVPILFAIAPQRQALLDWSRYEAKGLASWLWADKSPMLLAMAVNLLIVYGLLIPWTYLTGIGLIQPVQTAIAFLSCGTALMTYGTLIQIIMASRTRNPFTWAVGTFFLCLTIPPLILVIVQLTPDNIVASATLWAILGFPFAIFDSPIAFGFTLVGIVIQGIVLGGLLWQCDRTLKQLGQP
ncbi:MAG: hypothetical protein AB4042_01470, partial [Leptolyngbyaceae cyanobacterium]